MSDVHFSEAVTAQDHHVIDHQETDSSAGTATISAVSLLGKVRGCSKSASDCLKKAERLAEEFNHRIISAAHLVLAMTLIPNASRLFALRNVDMESAFRAAMTSLADMERTDAGNGAGAAASAELDVILRRAGDYARDRDNQDVSVDDLLTALLRLPPDSPAAELLRGGRKNDIGEDIRAELENFALRFGQQVRDLIPPPTPVTPNVLTTDILSTEVSGLATHLRDNQSEQLEEIKRCMQTQEEGLRRFIGDALIAMKAERAEADSAIRNEELPQQSGQGASASPPQQNGSSPHGGPKAQSDWLDNIFR